MNIGTELRSARERRGLTLDQLSARTKIQLRLLRALESDQLAALPGRVFTRGFVRAYADEVGLDPDETTRRFVAQDEERLALAAPGEAPIPDGGQMAPGADTPRARDFVRDSADFVRDSPWFTTALLVLGAALYLSLTGWPPSREASPGRPALGSGAVGPRSTQATGTAKLQQTTATAGSINARTMRPVDREMAETADTAATPPRTPLHISIQPRGRCWVAATADGNRVLYRLLQPGERHAIEARDDVILRVGDPETFDFAINGSSGRSLGRPGEPVTIHLTPANFHDYVR